MSSVSRSCSSETEYSDTRALRTYTDSGWYGNSGTMYDYSEDQIRLKKKESELVMDLGQPDLSQHDLTPPRRTPTKLHRCVSVVGKGVIAIHLAHIIVVAVLIFLVSNYVQHSFTDYPDHCLDVVTHPTAHNTTEDDNSYYSSYDHTGYSYGIENIKFKTPAQLAHLPHVQQMECEQFIAWWEFADHWNNGVILYAVVNGVVAILSAIYSYWLLRWMLKWQPKDARDLLHSIFTGFPKGSFMVSYNWGDENKQFGRPLGELPRAVGHMFPNSWLDIENLIPGTPVKETCGHAAQHALFRFTFISAAYLKSPNCQVEWDVIKPMPGRAIIFYYPDTPRSVVKELDRMGHWLVQLTHDSHKHILDPTWFVNNFVRSRRANPLFALHSPGINENWRATLRYWIGDFGHEFASLSLPLFFFAGAMIAADIVVAVVYKYQDIFKYYAVGAAVYGLAYILPLLLLFLTVYLAVRLVRTGFHLRALPDVADLLIMLRRLGVIDVLRVYSNDPSVTSTAEFQAIVDAGVVALINDQAGADVKILMLDSVSDNAYAAEEIDETFVFWSKKGFLSLSNYAKDTFGTYLIGDAVPNVEFLGCKMVMAAFNCNARELSVGAAPFKTLLKRNDPMSSKKGRCSCLRKAEDKKV